MALTVNTNIINDTDQYLLDAKNVKGTYVVVANTTERDSLPTATRVKGSLCYCSTDSTFYQYNGTKWVELSIKNQNAFSNVKVGDTTVAAESITDTLTLEGSNITITPDATNDKITFGVVEGTTGQKGIVKLSNTAGEAEDVAATPKGVQAAIAELAFTAPDASGSALAFIDSVSQTAGEITATKKLIQTASTSQPGIVQLNDSIESNVSTQAATAKAVKTINDKINALDFTDPVVPTSGTTTATAFIDSISQANGQITATKKNLPSASTSTPGIVKLSSTPSESAEDVVATPKGVYSAFSSYYINSGRKAGSAAGSYTTAEGQETSATTQCAHAEGYSTVADNPCAHAEGMHTRATGEASHAEGNNTYASGRYSHAEGLKSEATNIGAHAEGGYITTGAVEIQGGAASGEASHAEGAKTVASNRASHAEGLYTTASGEASHAEGYSCTAAGNYSSAHGQHTAADYTNQFVVGQYNLNKSNTLFEVGDGMSSGTASSNAFEVYRKVDNVSQGAKVSGTMTATTFNALSDARLKKNIVDYVPTNSILDLPIKEFDYIDSNIHTIGCLAQDLQKICPEIVTEGPDGYLSIAENKLVYLLLAEVKKLKEEISELRNSSPNKN